jgi:hypothetical protein
MNVSNNNIKDTVKAIIDAANNWYFEVFNAYLTKLYSITVSRLIPLWWHILYW